MHSNTLRRAFLHYFKQKGHKLLPSSPVVLPNDPTLLFANAGMNQFKDVFLGKEVRDYKKATTSQKCIRVGGKHNDLENVGHTERHLTFFEMLGNFSFGDYFKKEAIDFAWDVSTELFGFPEEKLFPSVYLDDDEAFELWTRYVPAERICRMGKEDNYWAMGDVGPSGPCSELYYDRGASYGPMSSPKDDPQGKRFLEFWNLVFMQYHTDASGVVSPLPNPSIDTGAGLERVLVLQMGVDSVFETDLLRALIQRIEEISGVVYSLEHAHLSPAFRVIADHVRTLSFCIADGVQPGNTDRGYVLRKILRRAVRYGKHLGFQKPFLAKILPSLVDMMGDDFPELKQRHNVIAELLTLEEENFLRTLQRGGNLLKEVMERAEESEQKISGQDAFTLKDTYGFPLEEVLLIAKDAHLEVDLPTYHKLEEEAKERSRQSHKKTHQLVEDNIFTQLETTSSFVGYETLCCQSVITAIVKEGNFVESLSEGETGCIVVEKTPFYATKGGQVADHGTIYSSTSQFYVQDCLSPHTDVIVHEGVVKKGTLSVGESVTLSVDEQTRAPTQNNHTATHLLHHALQQVLGDHVQQAGSLVEPKRLRFDFSHHKALLQSELKAIERLVNQHIQDNNNVATYELSLEEAQKQEEIKQFFGEKYGQVVRVVDIGVSKELCGGTHTSSLGTIGLFKIVKEGSIASGVRRIEAVTGQEAIELYQKEQLEMEEACSLLKATQETLCTKIKETLQEKKRLEKEIETLQNQSLQTTAKTLLEKQQKNHLIVATLELPAKLLRNLSDHLLSLDPKLKLVLVGRQGDTFPALLRWNKEIWGNQFHAKTLLQTMTKIAGGSGGGKEEMAQGVLQNRDMLQKACQEIETLLHDTSV